MKRVLVTNAGGRLGAGVSRALKAAPESIYLIGVDAHEVQLHRAVTHEKHLVPRADDEDYLPVLRGLIEDTRADFLWVNHESEIALVSKMADALGVATFLPAYETIALCQDKMAFSRRLLEAGIPAPESILVQNSADLEQAFCQLGPKLWLRSIKGTGGKGSLPTSDLETATRWIDLHKGWGSFMAAPCLTSEMVTWESIWDRGELMAAQAKRRLYYEFSSLTFSGVTGVGGANRWVADPVVTHLGMQAVKAVDPEPHGILGVDMTYDWQGMPKVTEINAGRFSSGGIVCVATPAYNMPYLVVQTVLGEKPSAGLPILDRLPTDFLIVHGIDVEAVFVDVQDVERCAAELQERRDAIRAEAPVVVGVWGGSN